MKNAIRNQLMITYIFLTIIPVMVISIYIINAYSSSIIEVEQSSLDRSYQQIDANLAKEITDYFYAMSFLRKDLQINQLDFLDENERNNVRLLLEGYKNQIDYVLSISVFDDDGNFLSSDDKGKLKSDMYQSSIMDKLKEQSDINILTNHKPGESPIVSANSEYIDTIHLFAREGTEDNIYINVMISSIMFEESVKNVDLGDGGYFYILTKGQQVVYTPVASNQLSKINDQSYLTHSGAIEATDWELYVVKPNGQVIERINILRNNLIMLFVITIIILIIITALFSGYIVKPIKKLQRLMQQVEKGDLSVIYEDEVNNEVHDLGIGFNKMLSKIRELIRQVKKEQEAKKATEIAMLQSNIKPHFLYNTLETIRWMSKKYEADDIADTVNALATFFRVGLSKGRDVIELGEEITHVESYLQIQKLRYGDIMDYDIDIEDKYLSNRVPKLILQPFVENALYHGIKESGDAGIITISGFTSEDKTILNLVVRDTGQGMSKDRYQQILSEMTKETDKSYISYGIKNVYQRIRLMYGENYGVSIESTEGVGTKVIIKLPLSPKDL